MPGRPGSAPLLTTPAPDPDPLARHSENFSSTSLNQNRELGLIISSHAVMSAIASTFAADFRNDQKWS